MPYIIAVLALVILGTGYTLFQTTPTSTPELTDESPVTLTENNPSAPGLIAEIFNDNDKETEEEEKDEEDRDDNPAPATTPEQQTSPKPDPAPTPAPAPAPAPMPVADNNTYTNGTYYTTKSYRTPDGNYQMNVSVTVSGDKITASTLSFDANGARDGYSKRFSSGYQNQIIGKDLGSASLSRVGGASLTTNAFNSALSNIKSQAS